MQDLAPPLIDFLVTCVVPTHSQRRVHVNIVTGEIQRDQSLEDNRPPRERAGEKDKQA